MKSSNISGSIGGSVFKNYSYIYRKLINIMDPDLVNMINNYMEIDEFMLPKSHRINAQPKPM